jgi:hypothetical protein
MIGIRTSFEISLALLNPATSFVAYAYRFERPKEHVDMAQIEG